MPLAMLATDAGIRELDNAADYRNSRGRIMAGPELLTVFNGEAGKAMHTIWYQPNRAFGTSRQVEDGEHLENAQLWSPDTPYLYTAEVTLYDNEGNIADLIKEPFGVRTIEIVPQKG